MTDLELLARAAHAAGKTFMVRHGLPCVYESSGPKAAHLDAMGWKVWNPLADDAEAFRLAVQQHIDIRVRDREVSAYGPGGRMDESYRGDAKAATRRAIVRAVAEGAP